jgi:hypothetical protein
MEVTNTPAPTTAAAQDGGESRTLLWEALSSFFPGTSFDVQRRAFEAWCNAQRLEWHYATVWDEHKKRGVLHVTLKPRPH